MAGGRVEFLVSIKTEGQKSVDNLKSSIDSIGSNSTTAKNLDKTRKSAEGLASGLDKTNKSGKEAQKTFRDSKMFQKLSDGLESGAKSAQLIDGPLGGVASRLTTLRATLLGINPVVAAFAITIGGAVKIMKDSVVAGAQLEAQMLTLQGVIRATGGAAGLTADEIDRMARTIDENTLGSAAGAREAAATLLTFRSIAGDTFERTLNLSADLAAVMGGDLRQASLQLAKALEEPTVGLNALRRSGVSFTEEQKELIKTLEDTGNRAAAQRIILDALEQQVGGAGAAQGSGLSGAVDYLAFQWTNFLEVLNDTSGVGSVVEVAIKGLAAAIAQLNDTLTFIDDKFSNVFGDGGIEERAKAISDEIEVLDSKIAQLGENSAAANATRELQALLEQEQELIELNSDAVAEYRKYQSALEDQALAADYARDAQKRLSDEGLSVEGLVSFIDASTRLGREAAAGLVTGFDEGLVAEGEGIIERVGLLQQQIEAKRREVQEKQSDESRQSALELRERQLRELYQAEVLAERQNAAKLATIRLDIQKATLDHERAEGLVSLEKYYDERQRIAKERLDAERGVVLTQLSNLNQQIADEQQRLADVRSEVGSDGQEVEDTEELIRLRTEQKTLEGELAAIGQRRLQAENAITIEAQKAAEAYSKAQDDLQRSILSQQSGQIGAGALINTEELNAEIERAKEIVDLGYRDLKEKARDFGTAEDQSIVEGLVQRDQVRAEFEVLENLVQQKLAAIQAIRDRINSGNVDGFEDIRQADRDVDQLTQDIQPLIRQMELLQGTDPELAEKFQSADAAINQATGSIDTFAQFFADNMPTLVDAFASGFANAFQGFIEGTQSAGDAFRSFASEFLKLIAQLLLRQAALNALQAAGFGVGAAGGGYIPEQAFARGGPVRGPGTSTSDSIPARLSAGEYVIRAAAVRKYGVGFFELLNQMMLDVGKMKLPQAKRITMPTMRRFNTGGFVSAIDDSRRALEANNKTPVNLAVVNVKDEDEAKRFLASRQGKEFLITFMNDNKSDIKATLK